MQKPLWCVKNDIYSCGDRAYYFLGQLPYLTATESLICEVWIKIFLWFSDYEGKGKEYILTCESAISLVLSLRIFTAAKHVCCIALKVDDFVFVVLYVLYVGFGNL